MNRKILHLQRRLYLVPAMILVVGLSSAVVIYLTSEKDGDNVLGYDVGGGYVYENMREDSKTYMRNMELYGGRANVLASELSHWFVGLWHGKSLGLTVACITILIAAGVFFVAKRDLE
ncbi:MAG TPA: hypothetical protein VFG09_10335 [Thermodesulfovibrionales bacterium]|jgi:hypothetical protein|nr:hypothetical protein [Thermodesulfovibrionales bacterium]